jgi:hypothetical protein
MPETKKKFCKHEILSNIVNSLLGGGLVFAGAITAGNVGIEQIIISIGAAAIISITKFKEFWEESYIKNKKKTLHLFEFVNLC